MIIGLIPFTGTFIESARSVGLSLLVIPGGFYVNHSVLQFQEKNQYCTKEILQMFLAFLGVFWSIMFFASIIFHFYVLTESGICSPAPFMVWGSLYGIHIIKKKAVTN